MMRKAAATARGGKQIAVREAMERKSKALQYSKLVAELTRSTNRLVAALRTRVQLAVRTEAQDNQDQEKQLTSNDAIMQRWVRNSEVNPCSNCCHRTPSWHIAH